MSVILGILTFFLVLVSLVMVLAILMQRSKDGGVGSALGGGVAEAAFGGESGNVLTKATTLLAVAFFVLSLGLYLGHLFLHKSALAPTGDLLPNDSSLVSPATDASTPTFPTAEDLPPLPAPETTEPTENAPAPAPIEPEADAPAADTPAATTGSDSSGS